MNDFHKKAQKTIGTNDGGKPELYGYLRDQLDFTIPLSLRTKLARAFDKPNELGGSYDVRFMKSIAEMNSASSINHNNINHWVEISN